MSKALAYLAIGLKGWHKAARAGRMPSRKTLRAFYEAIDLANNNPDEYRKLAQLVDQAGAEGRNQIQGLPVVYARMLLQGGLPYVD